MGIFKKRRNRTNSIHAGLSTFLSKDLPVFVLDCFFYQNIRHQTMSLINMLFTLTSCHCLWSPFSGTVHISSNLVLPSYPANIHNFQSYTAAPCAARATGFLSKSYINKKFFNNKILSFPSIVSITNNQIYLH